MSSAVPFSDQNPEGNPTSSSDSKTNDLQPELELIEKTIDHLNDESTVFRGSSVSAGDAVSELKSSSAANSAFRNPFSRRCQISGSVNRIACRLVIYCGKSPDSSIRIGTISLPNSLAQNSSAKHQFESSQFLEHRTISALQSLRLR